MIKFGIYGLGAALVDTEIQTTEDQLQRLGIAKGIMTLISEDEMLMRLNDLTTGQPIDAEIAEAPDGSQTLPDQQKSSHRILRACGGSAANSLIAAQCLGVPSFFSCQVARDPDGQFYAANLAAAGLTSECLDQALPGHTGKCLVLITPDAERSMNTYLGVSELLSIRNLNPKALSASRFVYLEGYLVTSKTGKPAAIEAARLARQAGVQIAISLSDPAIADYFREGLTEMMVGGVDLLFCNEAEALAFTQTRDLSQALKPLQQFAPQVAITRGNQPTWVLDKGSFAEVATAAVKAIDTNGAGDAFAGACLAGLCRGMSLIEAAAFGNQVAAQVVSQFGPRLTQETYAQLGEQLPPLRLS
jgi:sugar/nucleoside kinase (ribokinase family)